MRADDDKGLKRQDGIGDAWDVIVMRHVVVCLGFVSLLAGGVGLNACAESTDGSGLNPQPLPPDEKKTPGSSGEAPAPEDRGATDAPGSSGGATGNASGDAGVDGSPSRDGG
jgi:hypothetical protein